MYCISVLNSIFSTWLFKGPDDCPYKWMSLSVNDTTPPITLACYRPAKLAISSHGCRGFLEIQSEGLERERIGLWQPLLLSDEARKPSTIFKYRSPRFCNSRVAFQHEYASNWFRQDGNVLRIAHCPFRHWRKRWFVHLLNCPVCPQL